MLDSLRSFYANAVEKIIEIEGSMRGKSGEEKKNAVVDYLIDVVDIPLIPDSIETPIERFVYGFFVDIVVEKLNWLSGWNFDDKSFANIDVNNLAHISEFSLTNMFGAVNAPTASIDDRVNGLLKDYKIEPESVAATPAKVDDNNAAMRPTPVDNFPRSIEFVLKWEGGYVNDPVDKGGETNMGITLATLTAAFAQGLVSHNIVKKLTFDEVKTIYKANYWDKYGWGSLSWPMCLVLFDATVNHGGGGMAKIAQKTANSLGWNLVVDGKFGPKTFAALSAISNDLSSEFAENFIFHRKTFYDDIISKNPSQEKFRKGWYNRLNALFGRFGSTRSI